ncbi:MAG TPA: hypothetical protein VFY84_08295 [Jiangellales bacterium]|nr:hypothetical protein [Jiangellales bacterium]
MSVRLVVCDRADCPQPTVHTVLTVPRPDRAYGGTVAVAVDPASGNLALGYLDGTDGSLWLGGCPPGCADGPVLNRAGARPEYGADSPVLTFPSLQVVANDDRTSGRARLGGTRQQRRVPRAAGLRRARLR